MNYLETLLLIESRHETILAQDIHSLVTNQHRYLRGFDTPESAWQEDQEPGAPEKRHGRGGEYWVWKRQELLPDPPAQFPKGT